MDINLKSLLARLNSPLQAALEAALKLCKDRSHYNVEIEHLVLQLLENPRTDLSIIFKRFVLNKVLFINSLNRSLDSFRSGNTGKIGYSPSLEQVVSRAWSLASLNYGAREIRSGFVALAILGLSDLTRRLHDVSDEWDKISAHTLEKDFFVITQMSCETSSAAAAPAAPLQFATPSALPDVSPQTKTPCLDQYTVNLTQSARHGQLDPVLGRDHEIRQIIDILMRRRQNNPILTGEAGVGKTAVVEGFASRVAAGDVPPSLRNISVHALDLALLQAGAGVKGEFENRLKGLIAEVKASPAPIVLFIDEAHTMIGAGGSPGQSDAANLLKPALARGELRTIAATTWSEYKKYFEKDAALARRFQVVKVEEPSEQQCMTMLRGVVPSLEKHHDLRILDEAVLSTVKLSHRYLAGRQLPDKAVSVLDTACARLALGQNATPPLIEDAQRALDDLSVQQRVLQRESALGVDHRERLASIAGQKAALSARLQEQQARWNRERELVQKIRQVRNEIEQVALSPAPALVSQNGGSGAGAAVAAAVSSDVLASLESELRALQGESPLTQVCVDAQIISEVISAWTGIPVGKMVRDEISSVLGLDRQLGQRIIGQDHALQAIAQRIITSRAGLDDPGKPVGVFLLVGPSGVGKTETALALSDLLYGGERNLITINMSEFQEAHTVSTLKGSPPGYVGYGEGGVLTEAVRRRPYSVVLLDEVEKAHPDVLELFYQVFDKGVMEDGEGREIDFKNTIILLTTNACTDTLMRLCADPETMPTAEGLTQALKPELNRIFKSAFLGRMLIVPYLPVRDESLRQIVSLKLSRIRKRFSETHNIEFSHDDAVVAEITRRCTEVESGARNVDNILTNTLLPDVSRELLGRIAEDLKLTAVQVSIGPAGNFVYSW